MFLLQDSYLCLWPSTVLTVSRYYSVAVDSVKQGISFPTNAGVQSKCLVTLVLTGSAVQRTLPAVRSAVPLKCDAVQCVYLWRRSSEICCIYYQGGRSSETLQYLTRLHDVTSHKAVIVTLPVVDTCRARPCWNVLLVSSGLRYFVFWFAGCKRVSNSEILKNRARRSVTSSSEPFLTVQLIAVGL